MHSAAAFVLAILPVLASAHLPASPAPPPCFAQPMGKHPHVLSPTPTATPTVQLPFVSYFDADPRAKAEVGPPSPAPVYKHTERILLQHRPIAMPHRVKRTADLRTLIVQVLPSWS